MFSLAIVTKSINTLIIYAILNPAYYIHTRLAADAYELPATPRFTNTIDVIRQTKLKSYFHGFAMSCLGVFVYRGSHFVLDKIGSNVRTKLDLRQSFFALAIGATCSAIGAVLLSYPFETVRRRMMLINEEDEEKNEHSLAIAKRIYSESGWKGFFGGSSIPVSMLVGHISLLILISSITSKK